MDSVRFPEHGVELSNVAAAPGDTVRAFARWGAAIPSDGVPVDGYRVRWTVSRGTSGFPMERVVGALVDQVDLVTPPAPDSVCVTATVWATRQGRLSADSVHGTRCFRRPLAPPPAPGPVVIDTLAVQFDSVAVYVARSTVAHGDTVTACAAARQRVTGAWVLVTPAAVVRASYTGPSSVTTTPYPVAQCAFLDRLALQAGTYVPGVWRLDTLTTGGGGDGAFARRETRLGVRPGGLKWRAAVPRASASE